MTTSETLQEKILNEFLNSDIKIKSLDRLDDYISYCINNNQNEKILNEDGLSKTSYHHILPKAKDCFPEYKNLGVNKWNGTHLLNYNHYYAHWILTEAIDNYSQLFAFCAMHNQGIKNGRINESNLIPADEFQLKMVERNKKISEWRQLNTDIVKAASAKAKITCNKIQENGKTIYQEQGERVAQWYKDNPKEHRKAIEKGLKTKSDLIWQETIGKMTKETLSKIRLNSEWKETVGKQAYEKQKATRKKQKANGKSLDQELGERVKKWHENPENVQKKSENIKKVLNSKEYKETKGKAQVLKYKEVMRKKSIKKYGSFDLYSKDKLIKTGLSKGEVERISKALLTATKDKPVGSSNRSRAEIKKRNKEYLIGYYTIHIN